MSLADFMANIQQEGTTLEETLKNEGVKPNAEQDEQGKKTLAASPAEKKPDGESGSSQPETSLSEANTGDDNKIPFNKRPEYLRMKADYDRKFQEFMDRTEEKLDERLAAHQLQQPQNKQGQKPQWFVDAFGDDDEVWKKYSEYDQQRYEQLKKDIFGDIEKQRETQTKQSQEMDKWLDESLIRLSMEKGIDLNLGTKEKPNQIREDLLAVMTKYMPTDEKGNLDFSKGWEILEGMKNATVNSALEKQKSEVRKKIAGTTTPSSGGEKTPKSYRTAADFRGKSILDLVHGD